MFIHEAIKARTADKPFITRQSWKINNSRLSLTCIRLLPTNTPDCCIISSSTGRKNLSRGWQPTAEDLEADDWEIE